MSLGGRVGAEKLVNVVLSGLGWELKYIRNGRGLSLEVVCQQLRWQQSKLSRMENGQQHISDVDLGALLVIYQVHGDERRRLLHLADRQDSPGRWSLDSPTMDTLWRLEMEAISLVAAETLLIPGLAQTADYTRALMMGECVPPEQADLRIEKRMLRQDTLRKNNPPKLDMILDEWVLRRIMGSRAVMARQLRALLEFAERPNVRLWVLPTELGGNAGFNSSFYVLNFSRDKTVVFLENKESSVYIEDDRMIDIFGSHAARLGKAALDPAASMSRVATIAKEHERE
jgi:transcriptional regulator with XRE-family HTH domain